MPGVEDASRGACRCRPGSEGPFPVLDTLRRVTQELNNAANLDEGPAVVVRGVKRALRTFTRQRAQELAAEAIDAEGPERVHRLLNAAFEQAGLG